MRGTTENRALSALSGCMCVLLMLGVACWLNGCGGNPNVPVTYRVTGVVTYHDQPVANATVVFQPAEGRPMTAQTDAAGTFSLRTVAGPHTVTVTVSPGAPGAGGITSADAYAVPDSGAAGGAIPARYGDSGKSDLSANVTEDGDNEFEFTLVDQ